MGRPDDENDDCRADSPADSLRREKQDITPYYAKIQVNAGAWCSPIIDLGVLHEKTNLLFSPFT